MSREIIEPTFEVGSPSVEVSVEPSVRVTIVDDRGRPHVFRMTTAVALNLVWRLVEATTPEEVSRG